MDEYQDSDMDSSSMVAPVDEPPVVEPHDAPPLGDICRYCDKTFSGVGHDSCNFQRHVDSCKKNPKNRKRRNPASNVKTQKLAKAAKCSQSIHKFINSHVSTDDIYPDFDVGAPLSQDFLDLYWRVEGNILILLLVNVCYFAF